MKFEILDQNLGVAQVVETSASQVRIGKNASNELCLSDSSVSRVHAVLEKSGSGYKLSDCMSTGGTFVNDVKVEPSKPVYVTSGSILRFGNISVRVYLEENVASISTMSSIEDAMEEESGCTLAMAAPSLEELAAGAVDLSPAGSAEIAEMEAPEQAAAPAAPSMPPTPSAASMPPTPSAAAMPPAAPAPSVPKMAAAAAAAPKAGFGGFGGSGGFAQTSAPQTTIIKKKKRPVSFERRFLSARGKGNNCVLEAAMVWRDTVLGVKQFKTENGSKVCIGSDKNATFQVETGGKTIPLAQFVDGRWEIVFNSSFEGFILVGDKKTPFGQASNVEFSVPKSNGQLSAGSLACAVTGETRAKFVFGEVSILIHYVDQTPFAIPLFANFSLSKYGGLLASLIIHFSLFSVILFATDLVDALMIDRILTASRFAVVVEEPVVEEEPEEDKQDEEEPEEEEPEEDAEIAKDAPETPFAANTAASDSPSTNRGSGMSKGEAAAAAQATGLLAQANAMNSMLAAGMDMQLDNLDWSSFDASAQAASAGYGLGTTGTGGGGAGLGGFGGGGFGPGGAGGSGAIRAAGAGYGANLGTKGEAKPAVKMKNPEVTGSLDKRIIQKVVRQHSGELRNCYEKELAKVKGLNGRVVVVWLISPQGAVTKALVKETTIKNKNVENCVVNSIKFWRFPAPKGGGIVQIEYPFVFELSSN